MTIKDRRISKCRICFGGARRERGRESFSGNAPPRGTRFLRKRLPTLLRETRHVFICRSLAVTVTCGSGNRFGCQQRRPSDRLQAVAALTGAADTNRCRQAWISISLTTIRCFGPSDFQKQSKGSTVLPKLFRSSGIAVPPAGTLGRCRTRWRRATNLDGAMRQMPGAAWKHVESEQPAHLPETEDGWYRANTGQPVQRGPRVPRPTAGGA
jgi:hypothetical protein